DDLRLTGVAQVVASGLKHQPLTYATSYVSKLSTCESQRESSLRGDEENGESEWVL
ncbi:hypothetical protein HAX54_026950, partial [Datura stramonium]|nr:hypothetical protein [Datura stramonium]